MTFLSRSSHLSARLFEALLPPVCVSCSNTVRPGCSPLCAICETRLALIPGPHCPRCGFTRLSDLSSPGSCAECAGWAVQLERTESAFLFAPPAIRLVHGLKYAGWTSLAPRMGELMVDAARRLQTTPAVLTPVPLAPARLRERGFNQAQLLAEGLGTALGWPVRSMLARSRPGRRQALSSRRDRTLNVAGAYRITTADGTEARGMGPGSRAPVLLVDDVITTGATVAECARALVTAGVPCAGAVSFARTPPRAPGG